MSERGKLLPFYKKCSPQTCEDVYADVLSKQKSKDTTNRHRVGGLGWTLLKTEYGKAIKFKRCHQYEYVDEISKQKETQTCTEISPRAFSVPQETLSRYQTVQKFLKQVQKGKKGRASNIGNQVFALLASHTPRGIEQMTPAIISATLTGKYDLNHYRKVRDAKNYLTKEGKIKCERRRLPIILESPCNVPKSYMKIFSQFYETQKLKQVTATKLPEPEKQTKYKEARKLTKQQKKEIGKIRKQSPIKIRKHHRKLLPEEVRAYGISPTLQERFTTAFT